MSEDETMSTTPPVDTPMPERPLPEQVSANRHDIQGLQTAVQLINDHAIKQLTTRVDNIEHRLDGHDSDVARLVEGMKDMVTKDDLKQAVDHITVGEAAEARRAATARAVVDEAIARFKQPGAQAKIAGYLATIIILILGALRVAGQ